MDSEISVIEISSDEDDDDKGCSDLSNWFPDVLDKVMDFDSEVVVVDSLSCAASMAPKKLKVVSEFHDDDDCVILDGDPDKPVDIVKNGVEVNTVQAIEDSDDLVIVAEKGQLACRDYPHPRHLCATFVFCNTPHEKYCAQCHCYVCDKLAPCSLWGNGKSSTDHCHSTDKDKWWKLQRSSLKHGSLLKDTQKVSTTSFSTSSSYSYHNNNSSSSRLEATLPQPLNGCLFSQQPYMVGLHSPQLPVSNPLQPCSAHQHQHNSKLQSPYLSHYQFNHRVQRENQDRLLSPRMHQGSSTFKRPGFVRDGYRNAPVHTSSRQQHGVTNNQSISVHQNRNQLRPMPVNQQRKQHQPVPMHQHRKHHQPVPMHQQRNQYQPHHNQHSSTVTSEKRDERPHDVLPVNAPINSPNIQHMLLSNLESHLGLSDNRSNYNFANFSTFQVSSQSTGWNTPTTEISDDNSNILNYPLCTVPCQADVNLFQNSPPKTSQQLALPQPINLSVLPLNGNIDSAPLPSRDWMSLLSNSSPDICADPAIPPGLSPPEFLPNFDFEVEGKWSS